MDEKKKPSKLRTILLALPRRRRRKYRPRRYRPGHTESGVRPSAVTGECPENWRINMLAEPRVKGEKYVYIEPDGGSTGIHPSTLAHKCSQRTNDMSKPTIRYLTQTKKFFKSAGPKFIKTIDKTIKASWATRYNYYTKALNEILKKRRAKDLLAERTKNMPKDKKGKVIGKIRPEKEVREEKLKHALERCGPLAIPKPFFAPPPIDRGPIANLDQLAERMSQLAEPTGVTLKYIRPSKDPLYVDPLKVSQRAITYVANERVLKLAECPAHRLIKPPIYRPGAVKRSALTCKVSPRFLELAVPKKKAAEKDNDLKENPFEISKNALKYVATARILELAKHVERD